MEITVSKALEAQSAIEDVKDIAVPAKVGYRLGRLGSKLESVRKQFDKTRNELIKNKYGVPAESDPNSFTVPADKMKDFLEEISATLETKEAIEVLPLNVSDFEDVKVPANFFTKMGEFIVE